MKRPGAGPPLDDLDERDDRDDAPPVRVRRPRAAPLDREALQDRDERALRAAAAATETDDSGAPEPGNPAYRRRSKPVAVRRNRWADFARLARRGWKPLLAFALCAALCGAGDVLLFHSGRFVLASSSQIALHGNRATPAATLDAVFAPDLGRNIFYIPLDARCNTLDQIPWIQSAEVRRLWPAQLEVRVTERTPVAFARAGNALLLVDAAGVVLDRPATGTFDFPVVNGLTGVNSSAPNRPDSVAARHDQLKAFIALRDDLDRGGAHASADLSEINVSHPGNLAARVPVPGSSDTMLVKFGDQDYAARYQMYLSHIAQWRQQYPQLIAVDLHVDGEAAMENAPPAPKAPTAGPNSKTRPAPPSGRGGHSR